MKKHIQSQTEWEQGMAHKILEYVQSELFLDMPYMSIALNSLTFSPNDEIETMATNGKYLYYSEQKMIELFKKNTRFVLRAYLHSIFHCLFSHLWIRQDRDVYRWNIACDIAVEYTIDSMHKKSTERILSLLRKNTYSSIKENGYGFSAPAIYVWLKSQKNIETLNLEFHTDDHRFWPKEEKQNMAPNLSSIQKNWQKIAQETMLDQKRRSSDGEEAQKAMAMQVKAAKQKRSYKEFLQKFALRKEETKVDVDTFDIASYVYGLSLYGNMPLMEPVETKEVKKIQEFVIVIDTSESTKGDLVEKFVKETVTVLLEQDSFFSTSQILILQCDDKIESADWIHDKKDLDAWMHHFTLKGGGNTDFRPAFEYVNQCLQQKKMKEVQGLIYYTDGKGTYPKQRPSYPCAFIFLEDQEDIRVPTWAIQWQLDPLTLEKGK